MLKYIKQLNKSILINSLFWLKKEFIVFLNYRFLNKSLIFLKLNEASRFDLLIDICAVDFIKKKSRFEIVYNILSIKYNSRIRVKLYINEIDTLESISLVFFNASWVEREIWDLFGIFFKFHPDLRRILTDYGFKGYPLRKDFPLTGFFEVYYDYYKKLIIFSKLELLQKYYNFNYINPWF